MDPGFGWEDLVWSDSQRFLEERTVTYVVTAVRSRLVPNNTVEVYGMQGFRALTQKRYKMQVLQLSNYHGNLDRYGPNALLKEETDVTSLLQRGVEPGCTAVLFQCNVSYFYGISIWYRRTRLGHSITTRIHSG
jgi:hypothetical protein